MDAIKSLFSASPLIPLFLCVALGYAIGKPRIGRFQLGGVVGTLFVGIVVGQIGVETNDILKTMAFALFIYALGFVCGPQFFASLGRATLDQVHLTVFNSAVVFGVIWGLAQVLELDKGTAAGLLAGATTESASVGTASEALEHLGLEAAAVKSLQANIGVSYAVTYLFGFTLTVFYVSVLAPPLLGIDLKEAAKTYENELGETAEVYEAGQEQALKNVLARAYEVTEPEAAGLAVGDFEKAYNHEVTIEQVVRRGRAQTATPDLALERGDRVALIGRLESIVSAGESLGEETANLRGMGFVGETLEVVLTNKDFVGATIEELDAQVDPERRRGVYISKVSRAGIAIEPRPRTRLQAGDIFTLYGSPEQIKVAAQEIGYAMERSDQVDYVYLGLGMIVGILLGMVSVTVAGSPVSVGTGGGCLISGLVFGWLRAKHPTFGSLPAATALHLRDFGLAVFVASVGLAVGPQAMTLLMEKGILLPILSVTVVLIPLTSSLLYAKYVLRMNPIVICGALAGTLTCTAGLNATVAAAESSTPVLGYTVPYAIGNVILTLLGPVIVLTV